MQFGERPASLTPDAPSPPVARRSPSPDDHRSPACRSAPDRGSEIAAVADAELLHRPVQMQLDRTDREHEPLGHLGVRQTVSGELDELTLVGREVDR